QDSQDGAERDATEIQRDELIRRDTRLVETFWIEHDGDFVALCQVFDDVAERRFNDVNLTFLIHLLHDVLFSTPRLDDVNRLVLCAANGDVFPHFSGRIDDRRLIG